MITRKVVYVTVNEINELIRKYYTAHSVCIESVDVTSINNQYSPRTEKVGVGGVLTIKAKVEYND